MLCSGSFHEILKMSFIYRIRNLANMNNLSNFRISNMDTNTNIKHVWNLTVCRLSSLRESYIVNGC